jgi:hypothetical protein
VLAKTCEKAVFPCLKNKMKKKPLFNLLIKRIGFLGKACPTTNLMGIIFCNVWGRGDDEPKYGHLDNI